MNQTKNKTKKKQKTSKQASKQTNKQTICRDALHHVFLLRYCKIASISMCKTND